MNNPDQWLIIAGLLFFPLAVFALILLSELMFRRKLVVTIEQFDYSDTPAYHVHLPNGVKLIVLAGRYTEPGAGKSRLPNRHDPILTVMAANPDGELLALRAGDSTHLRAVDAFFVDVNRKP